MRPLLIFYDSAKQMLLQQLKGRQEFGIDYDVLRERGVNPRLFWPFPDISQEDNAEVATTLEFLETVGTGILILSQPEYLRIALAHGPFALNDCEDLIHQSVITHEHDRNRSVSALCQQAHPQTSTYGEDCVDLFKVLRGEENGPWNIGLKGGRNLRRLQALGMMTCFASETKFKQAMHLPHLKFNGQNNLQNGLKSWYTFPVHAERTSSGSLELEDSSAPIPLSTATSVEDDFIGPLDSDVAMTECSNFESD